MVKINKYFEQNTRNPYPGESQSATAYKKGFYEAWELLAGKAVLVGNNRKPKPEEISPEEHIEKLRKIFTSPEQCPAPRKWFIKKLVAVYGVGVTKIERKGGYLNHLLKKGFILKIEPGEFKLNPEYIKSL